jgi:hypothetical protein
MVQSILHQNKNQMNSNQTIQIYEEQLQKLDLHFLEFQNNPLPSQEEDKKCETCTQRVKRCTRNTSKEATFICSHPNCQESVCESCVVCTKHFYYQCPCCLEDAVWHQCIFIEKEFYNLNCSRNWKFIHYFRRFYSFPWIEDELFVGCASCVEEVLCDIATVVNLCVLQDQQTGSTFTIKKRKLKLSEETSKERQRGSTYLTPHELKHKFK